MRFTLPAALVTCLALTACGKQEAPATGPVASPLSAAPEKSAAPEWDSSAAPVAGATLSVVPNPVDFCNDKLQAVDVNWDVTQANPTSLQIWMEDAKGNRKLWVAPSARTGTKTTGKWMTDGAKVIAVDSVRSRVLNTVTIAAAPCK